MLLRGPESVSSGRPHVDEHGRALGFLPSSASGTIFAEDDHADSFERHLVHGWEDQRGSHPSRTPLHHRPSAREMPAIRGGVESRGCSRVKATAGWAGGAAVIASRGVQRWRVGVRGDRERTRWLADVEADHGGGVTRVGSGAHEPGAGAAAAKAVTPADRDMDERARPGEDGVRAGGAGRTHQTELAESEAVSGDRTRPPRTARPRDGHAVAVGRRRARPTRR